MFKHKMLTLDEVKQLISFMITNGTKTGGISIFFNYSKRDKSFSVNDEFRATLDIYESGKIVYSDEKFDIYEYETKSSCFKYFKEYTLKLLLGEVNDNS